MNLEKELSKIKSQKEKTRLKREAAELILSEIENHTRAGVSPVTGRNFEKLSKEYAKKKRAMGKGSSPDLHLKDKMIESMRADIKKNGIEFKITNATEKKKAFNHITGDTLPARPFLPDDKAEGKEASFAPAIKRAIKELFDNANQG